MGKGKRKKREPNIHMCVMAAPKDKGLVPNFNDPMATDGMAAAYVIPASKQAKSNEF